MSKLFNLKIDVSKIDKSKLYQGEKGTYLSLTCSLKDVKDDYGNDVSAWIEQTKEERESGQNKIYLGNGKVFWSDNGNSTPQPVQQSQPLAQTEEDDLLPF